MIPIRILSRELELLAEIDNYESLQFTRRFYKPGELELHINVNKQHTDKLTEDNIIMLGADSHKAGIIRHREIKLDDKGKATEELLIKGPTLQGITSRRVAVPPSGQAYDRIRASAETVTKHYVNTNILNPEDPARVIPEIIIAADQVRGIEVPWQTRYEQLDTLLQGIAEWCDIGWDIYLDFVNKKMVFEVFTGRNITAGQNILPPVIFSTDFDNIKLQQYIDSVLDYKNVGYAGGQGEEETRLIQQIGDAEGLARLETFLDCSDAADIDELIANGQQKLAELKRIRTFEMSVSPSGSFIYGQDWDLGDMVTLFSRKWGITMDARVSEIKEIYETAGFNLEVTFGNSIPTLVDKLKRQTRKIVG